jgi:Tol biopolymer transport system component
MSSTRTCRQPDGRWLAFQSRESGQFDVWVQRLRDGVPKPVKVTSNGATRPTWTRGGHELVFVAGNREIWSLSIDTAGNQMAPGTPNRLFRADLYIGLLGRTHDVTDDGERFVIVAGRTE